MIEFIFMVVATVVVLLFLITPCLLAALFDYAPCEYMKSVKAGIYFWGFIIVLCFVVLVISLVINFISGDPQPITTLIERITQE